MKHFQTPTLTVSGVVGAGKQAIAGGRYIARQALRLVAASATAAFLFTFATSLVAGGPATWTLQQQIPYLPTDPLAMFGPVYTAAVLVAALAVGRVGLAYVELSRHWATVGGVLSVATFLTFAIFTASSWTSMAAVLVYFAMLLTAPMIAAAWVLDVTTSERQQSEVTA